MMQSSEGGISAQQAEMLAYRPHAHGLSSWEGVPLLVAFGHVQVAVPLAADRDHLLAILGCDVPRHLHT